MELEQDTIAAIATPGGRGGIGIIKISGLNSFAIARSIFRPGDLKPPGGVGADPVGQNSDQHEFETHRIYYGHIVDPDTGKLLDEVLVSAMKAPRTYTREDVVEINAHGGGSRIAFHIEACFENGRTFR